MSANETLFEAARAGDGQCVLGDDRLYAASEDGEVYVVAAGPGLTETARNDMKEIIMGTPAISGGMIFVRTMGHVYRIGQ